MTEQRPSKEKVRAFRNAVDRFLTSASNPGRAAAVVHDNTPGSPYHDLVMAKIEIDAMLDGPAHEPPAVHSACPFCDSPCNDEGHIWHVAGCEGLQDAGLNKLQHWLLSRAAQPPEALRPGLERADEIISAIETPADQYEPYKNRLLDALRDAIYSSETKGNVPEIPPDSMPPDPGPDPTKLEYDEWVARTKECPACHGQGCEPHECDDGRLIQGPPCERCEGAGRIALGERDE